MNLLTKKQVEKIYEIETKKIAKQILQNFYSNRLLLLDKYLVELNIIPNSYSEALAHHYRFNELNRLILHSLLEE